MYDDFGPDMDDHRACALSFFCREYYKHDLRVKDWLDSKWSEWERDPPEWFDDAFIALIPPEWLPAQLRPERRKGMLSKIIPMKSISKIKESCRLVARVASFPKKTMTKTANNFFHPMHSTSTRLRPLNRHQAIKAL